MESRIIGLSHIYLDEKSQNFSNLALGYLVRATGANLKIAYVNYRDYNQTLTHVFNNQNLEIYTYNHNELKNYDLIIFDNCTLELIDENTIKNLLQNKQENTEIIFIFSKKHEFETLVQYFDLASELRYSQNQKGKQNLTNITGNGKGKSTWCFGYYLKNILEGKKTKLIYFDKGGNFYSEMKFFKTKNFDFINYGTQRFEGKKFRFSNNEQDYEQAKKALNELKNIPNGNQTLIAEELNTTIKSNLLNEIQILDILTQTNNTILISGRYSTKNIQNLCATNIEVKEIKHYSKKGFGVREGIDY